MRSIDNPSVYSIYNINNIYNTNYYVIDIETNLIDKVYSIYKQSPKYILGGILGSRININTPDINTFCDYIVDSGKALVGHNISYDILVAASQHKGFRDYVLRSPCLFIWDTAVYEYMASGQTSKYPSLKDCAEYHKLGISKDDEVSEMIKAGIDPESIYQVNPDLLNRYLTADLKVTELLYHVQLENLVRHTDSFINLVLQRQQFLLNTIRMSITGMPFNVLGATNDQQVLELKVKGLEQSINDRLSEILQRHTPKGFVPQAEEDDYFLHTMDELTIEPEPVNCNSSTFLKSIFFGGDIGMVANGITGVYKTGARKGEPKYKTISFDHPIPGLLNLGDVSATNMDDTALAEIEKSTNEEAKSLAASLREYRGYAKKLSTYFNPYINAVTPEGRIHCDYNHTATPTGRITSSKPNLQNVEGE